MLFNAGEGDPIVQSKDSNDDNDDSDYNKDDDCSTTNDDDYEEDLDTYCLLFDDYRTYGNPSDDIFPVNDSLTGTIVLKFQSLGAIQKQKSKSQKQSNISKQHILKGVVEQAVVI